MATVTRKALSAVALTGLGAIAWGARQMPAQFGAQATGERAARMRRSAQYSDGHFHNRPHPPRETAPMSGALRAMFTEREGRRPDSPIPVVSSDLRAARDDADTTGLHLTWLGHATSLVEIDGRRVLIDPVWSDRCSPSPLVGPRRLHEPPVAIADLPTLDAVVISHDHYDHLDMTTIKALTESQEAPFLVPLGIGAHLDAWGVPAHRIIELDWDESAEVAGLTLTATPAQHFSGRLFERDRTLWASWVVAGPEHRVFYSGDTGYFDGFAEIGATHGPFDLALVQVGAYADGWPEIHMTPEEGVATALDVRARLTVPVHWGTFTLAPHPWSEPVDRLWAEAKARGIDIAVPRPGARVDAAEPGDVDPWWQVLTR